MKEVAEMLRDIRKIRAQSLGEQHASVAEAACAICLLFICLKDSVQAGQSLQEAQQVLTQENITRKLGSMLDTAQAGVRFAITVL